MKVFVTGASGQLGRDVCIALQLRGISCQGVSSKALDIRSGPAVERMLKQYRPDTVIHCAAWTEVDLAQERGAEVMAVNVQGTQHLVKTCRELGCKLVYISTDYVFSGKKAGAYETGDEPCPLNVYGQSKLEGEFAVTEGLLRYFIVRTSWAFGLRGNNFVESMLRLGARQREIPVVCDQVGSPTYTKDLAALLCDMIGTEKYGIYHATNEGNCSWAEFAQEIFHQSNMEIRIRPVSAATYGAKVMRPANSVLDKSGLIKAGFSRLPTWQDALSRYLHERQKE